MKTSAYPKTVEYRGSTATIYLQKLRNLTRYEVRYYDVDGSQQRFTFTTAEAAKETAEGWLKYPQGVPIMGVNVGQSASLRPKQVSSLTMPVWVYAPPYPWRVSIFWWRPPIKPGTIRFNASIWLEKLNMPKLAHMLLRDFKATQVAGPQMEQWEK